MTEFHDWLGILDKEILWKLACYLDCPWRLTFSDEMINNYHNSFRYLVLRMISVLYSLHQVKLSKYLISLAAILAPEGTQIYFACVGDNSSKKRKREESKKGKEKMTEEESNREG